MNHSPTARLKKPRTFGTWPSEITPELVAAKTLRFGMVKTDRDWLYWSEYRPSEGRTVIMRSKGHNQPEDVLPASYSARSSVHEYGGGEFSVKNNKLVFVNSADQDLYLIDLANHNRLVQRLTNSPNVRYADVVFDEAHNRLIAVAERYHADDASRHPQNLLKAIALDTSGPQVKSLVEGHDFFASPCISPDGAKLAWLSWDLPDMPWDSAALYVADILADGSLSKIEHVAGGHGVAVFQPEWGDDNTLYFVSDEGGFGNLWCRSKDGQLQRVTAFEGDLNRPLWSLGMRSYAFQGNGLIWTSVLFNGKNELCLIDDETDHDAQDFQPELRSFESLATIGNDVFGIATTDFEAPSIVKLDKSLRLHHLRKSIDLSISKEDISVGKRLCFENARQQTVYGLYYPPTNSQFEGLKDEKPPLILMVHGGPTGAAERGLKLKIQFWTSRGFAVFDLDYSGSTGYGRAYRERLNKEWGLLDVEDVAAAVAYLTQQELADPHRLVISGGSAGGFTVLSSLAQVNVFAAASCSYGVADLLHLQNSTHKFEAGYLFRLLGITPPQKGESLTQELFHVRSPVMMADKITSPVIFFQGLEDKVVPPEQTRRMVDVLRAQNLPVKMFEFEGEGHGFRKIETVKTVLEEELKFFSQHLKLVELC